MEIFHIVSSNIRYKNSIDGVHHWDHRKFILSKFILEFEPHIIGTQEGRESQIREFNNLLQEFEIIDQHRQWIDDRMYPALLIRKNHFNIIESGDIWLSETPYIEGSSSFESAFPRLCTWAILETKKMDHILVINTHLDHVLNSTREKQIEVLLSELKLKILNFPTILLGDFNSLPSERTRKKTEEFENTFFDPWLTLKKEEQSSYHSFKGTNNKNERIDWILHTKDFLAKDIEIDNRDENNIFPSDHFILKSKLHLKID